MTGSQTITKIAAAFHKAQCKMGNATKSSSNPFFKSSYADLNSIRETVTPVLNEVGISVLQPTITLGDKNFVETVLLHESGEWLAGLTEIVNVKGDAQSEGSGISYARRYGLQSICNVGAVDDDGEAAQGRKTVQRLAGETTSNTSGSLSKTTEHKKTAVVSETVPKSDGTGSRDLITGAFKVLEAQGKISKEAFKTNYLQGKGISTVAPSELPAIYSKLMKDFPSLNGSK